MSVRKTRKTISRTATLSSYGPVPYGYGHTVKGKAKQKDEISVAESLSFFSDMLGTFRSLPLGTKIKVTMTAMNGKPK